MVSVWSGAVPGATRVWRSRTVRAAWRRLDHCHGGGARPIPGNRSHGSALTVRAARTTSVCPWSSAQAPAAKGDGGTDAASSAARSSYAGERHEPTSEQRKCRGSRTSVADVAKLSFPQTVVD